ncbi:hypothetical protein VE02_10024 [Pseudogymnoascus sp. 03VT05]|nr:hypothetical protein VE02_10024 [Pseudogymnoascus sp. 03VT05]
MSLPAPIIQCAVPSIQDPLIVFRSPTVHQRKCKTLSTVSVGMSRLLPILRSAMPMFVATQSMFDSCACILDEGGRTPLCWAAERGHEAVVKLLVEREDVVADSKDEDGRTPLCYAAERGNEAVVKLLVEREDVVADSKDEGGRTLLCWAAESGHEAVVKLLVERTW